MMTDRDRRLLRDLETAALPPGGFSHREHVRAAWALFHLEPPRPARDRFRALLRRFARHAGAPGLYHETITSAFLFAIHERIERQDRGGRRHGWAEFARANPELVADGRGFLAAYYSPERLESAMARRQFLLPDRPGPRGSIR